jgi:hypothetical protein
MLKNIPTLKVVISIFDSGGKGLLLPLEEPVECLLRNLGFGLPRGACEFGKLDLIFGSKFDHHPLSVRRHTCRVKRVPATILSPRP